MHGFWTVGGKEIGFVSQMLLMTFSVSLQFKTENLWTHFDDRGDVPSLEELFDRALTLWDNYSNPGTFTKFVTGHRSDNSVVPIGEPWRKEEDTDLKAAPRQATDDGTEGGEGEVGGDGGGEMKGKGATSVTDKEFRGDWVLARSTSFMHQALVSKEVAQAVAEGDVGRVYEGIKVSSLLHRNTGFPTIYCRQCWSRLRAPHISSILVTCSTRLASWSLTLTRSCRPCFYRTG